MPHPADHLTAPARRPSDERAHYNLHTGGYSVDRWRSGVGWRLAETVPTLYLRGAYCRFQRGAWLRYIATMRAPGGPNGGRGMGVRNVHAHVYGEPSAGPIDPADGTWRRARYCPNPPCFADTETGLPLPNDRTLDVYLDSVPNVDGRRVYRSGRKPPAMLPTMYWRPSR